MPYAALGMGLLSGFMSYKGQAAKLGAQAYNTTFTNEINKYKAEADFEEQERAFERTKSQTQEQYKLNAEAAETAFGQENAAFIEKMSEFAYANQALTQQISAAQGFMNARTSATEGGSQKRLEAIGIRGRGARSRNQLRRSQESAARQSNRNYDRIAREWIAADRSAFGAIVNSVPVKSMAVQQAMPRANTGLMIGQAVMAGINTADGLMPGGVFGKSSYQNTALGDLFGIKRKTV